jgi:hypothetical protein
MSATFAKLFSSVCPRASDFTGHFSASMLVKTTNTAQDELRDEVSEVDEFVGTGP